ncbi:MAG TPA: hypothetical protein VGO52_21085 [Hyphomonadaceae bacterium]|nr:hypothetical protein [Hyphomonadaceae bacterium]
MKALEKTRRAHAIPVESFPEVTTIMRFGARITDAAASPALATNVHSSPIPLKNSTAEAFDPSVKADGELERPALRPA